MNCTSLGEVYLVGHGLREMALPNVPAQLRSHAYLHEACRHTARPVIAVCQSQTWPRQMPRKHWKHAVKTVVQDVRSGHTRPSNGDLSICMPGARSTSALAPIANSYCKLHQLSLQFILSQMQIHTNCVHKARNGCCITLQEFSLQCTAAATGHVLLASTSCRAITLPISCQLSTQPGRAAKVHTNSK